MGPKILANILFLMVLAPCFAYFGQGICITSWKKGDTRVVEQTFTFSLDNRSPSFRRIINDKKGRPFLNLVVAPGWAGKPRKIIEWRVELTTIKDETDLLKPTNDPYQDSLSAEDLPGWFLLGSLGQKIDRKDAFPVDEKRVVAIEAFYCVLSIQKFKRDPVVSSAFKTALFQIELTNKYADCK